MSILLLSYNIKCVCQSIHLHVHPSICLIFFLFLPNYWSICLHIEYSSYPPLEECFKMPPPPQKKQRIGMPHPKIHPKPKNDQKCVFINYGDIIYCWKARGKGNLKNKKKFTFPILFRFYKKITTRPKNEQKVWLCHIPLETQWKGDFKKSQNFLTCPADFLPHLKIVPGPKIK